MSFAFYEDLYLNTLALVCGLTFGKRNLYQVYDVTPFVDDHPGGDQVLLAETGKAEIYKSCRPGL